MAPLTGTWRPMSRPPSSASLLACACLSGHGQRYGPDRMVVPGYHLVAGGSALGVAPDVLCREAGIL